MNIDKLQGGRGNAVAFLETTKTYAQIRFNLYQKFGEESLKYLSHIKYGTFLFALGLDTETESLLTLGAYGSSIEGSHPTQLQYIIEQENPEIVSQYCSTLPPLIQRNY